MDRQILRLEQWIEGCEDLDAAAAAMKLHGELCSRVTRMRESLARMGGGQDEELRAAINQALDELSVEWGVKL